MHETYNFTESLYFQLEAEIFVNSSNNLVFDYFIWFVTVTNV
jgi:hypothetical protein